MLSVIIPCHNDGKYLTEAVESVLKQESPVDVEIIIVNDQSSDEETLEILDFWEKNNDQVRVFLNSDPSGPAGSRNFGINMARGEWIAFLDADDYWLPGAIHSRWQVIEKHPDAQWIGADFIRMYENGMYDEMGHFKTRLKTAYKVLFQAYASESVLRLPKPINDFLYTSLASTCTVMVKHSLLKKVGCFETRLKQAEDNHLWYRLANKVDYFFVPRIVAVYRQHKESVTHRERPPGDWEIKAFLMLLQNTDFQPYWTVIRHKLAKEFCKNAYYYRAQRNLRQAVVSSLDAIRNHPTKIDYWRVLLGALLRRS